MRHIAAYQRLPMQPWHGKSGTRHWHLKQGVEQLHQPHRNPLQRPTLSGKSCTGTPQLQSNRGVRGFGQYPVTIWLHLLAARRRRGREAHVPAHAWQASRRAAVHGSANSQGYKEAEPEGSPWRHMQMSAAGPTILSDAALPGPAQATCPPAASCLSGPEQGQLSAILTGVQQHACAGRKKLTISAMQDKRHAKLA